MTIDKNNYYIIIFTYILLYKSDMLDVKVIGEGSFSRIIQVKVKNKIRVIKKLEYESIDDVIMLTPKTLRELVFLQYIDSKYVIKPTNITNTYLYMQNEGNNLYEYITGLKNSNSLLSWTEYKLIFWQIVRGIFDIHNKGIIHGDIKPQNILYSKKSNSVKICDFNFSTLDDGSISGKSYTLQYRPLESLLSTYNNKSDIWALGCTMWELFAFKPLFEINRQNQETDVNEYIIHAVTSKLGSPSDKLIKKYNLESYVKYFDMNKNLNSFNGELNNKFSIDLMNNCNHMYFDTNTNNNLTELNSLIIKMLSYDVCDRPSASEILNSTFFNDFNVSEIPYVVNCNYNIDDMVDGLYCFLTSKKKCDSENIYRWILKCVLSRLYLNKELDFYEPPEYIQKKYIDEKIDIRSIDFGIAIQDILQLCNYDLLGCISRIQNHLKIPQYF